MALTRGKRIGGAFLDLKELAADGPVLCVFRIREFHEAEKASGYEGTNVPVVADVLVCDGKRKGEVHLNERLIGSITGPLRGVPNPRKEKNIPVLPPETEVGQEIVLRVKVLNPGKSNASAGGDEPSDTEMKAVEAFYGDGIAVWAAAEAQVPAQNNGAEPVGAGSGKKPW